MARNVPAAHALQTNWIFCRFKMGLGVCEGGSCRGIGGGTSGRRHGGECCRLYIRLSPRVSVPSRPARCVSSH